MSKPSDDQLRQAIDAIFNKYDSDKSGTLEGSEIFSLISDAFKSLGRNRQVKEEEVNQFIKAIDKNGDSKISKVELFEILKKLISAWFFTNRLLFHSAIIFYALEFTVNRTPWALNSSIRCGQLESALKAISYACDNIYRPYYH